MSTRPICKSCGKNKAKPKELRNGKQRFKSVCSSCYKKARVLGDNPLPVVKRKAARARRRARLLKSCCEQCQFVPLIPQQLQLDHKDGNRRNNHPGNLQTLCANCHVYKTITNGDNKPRDRPSVPYVYVGGKWLPVEPESTSVLPH